METRIHRFSHLIAVGVWGLLSIRSPRRWWWDTDPLSANWESGTKSRPCNYKPRKIDATAALGNIPTKQNAGTFRKRPDNFGYFSFLENPNKVSNWFSVWHPLINIQKRITPFNWYPRIDSTFKLSWIIVTFPLRCEIFPYLTERGKLLQAKIYNKINHFNLSECCSN